MKIVDFISKISEDINIKVVDNGFLVEISGRNAEDSWESIKLVCKDRKELNSYLDQALALPRDK